MRALQWDSALLNTHSHVRLLHLLPVPGPMCACTLGYSSVHMAERMRTLDLERATGEGDAHGSVSLIVRNALQHALFSTGAAGCAPLQALQLPPFATCAAHNERYWDRIPAGCVTGAICDTCSTRRHPLQARPGRHRSRPCRRCRVRALAAFRSPSRRSHPGLQVRALAGFATGTLSYMRCQPRGLQGPRPCRLSNKAVSTHFKSPLNPGLRASVSC